EPRYRRPRTRERKRLAQYQRVRPRIGKDERRLVRRIQRIQQDGSVRYIRAARNDLLPERPLQLPASHEITLNGDVVADSKPEIPGEQRQTNTRQATQQRPGQTR